MKKATKILIGTGIAAFVGVGAIVGVSHADRSSHHGYKMRHHKSMPMKLGFHDMRRHLYGIVDTDGDEKLTQAEIDAAHAARRAKYDTDGDGNLSLSEFAGLWTELTQPLKIRGFQFLDTDGDAKISKAEIDERLASMVRHFDRNGNGTLSMEDRRYRHWSRQSDDDDDKGKR
jgi:Ca2+-binding EF-hand superfamily protein